MRPPSNSAFPQLIMGARNRPSPQRLISKAEYLSHGRQETQNVFSGIPGTRYLEGFEVDPDAMVELKARACNMQTGCFRLLDRTLSNVTRILEERGERVVTVKIIEQASSLMML